jgi:hypothetical protein
MSYNNRFKSTHFYSLPINVDSDNHLAGIVPDDRIDYHLSIDVKSSDSQSQNDLVLIGATAWQVADAIRISPDGGAPTTGYFPDSVGGPFHPGQNPFPAHFGLINAANDLFESGVANGITAYNFAGKGKALDSDYIHTQDLHAMDSNSIFDSGRAYDMFLNERSINKLFITQYQELMPIHYTEKLRLDYTHRESDYGPYPGNIVTITPTNPEVFPIGFDSNAIAAAGAGGGGGAGAVADPESWS